MHIYAFGSVCRGEVTLGSDVDLLACVADGSHSFDSEKYSIYTYDRLHKLWEEGNPFAWHLHTESKLIYASDDKSFLKGLGTPAKYKNGIADCEKFYALFLNSKKALESSDNSAIFNLSSIFLSVRNMATCYALSGGKTVFSRRAAYLIEPPITLSLEVYSILERARILATRGYGVVIDDDEKRLVKINLDIIKFWMKDILCKVNEYE